MGKFQVTGRIFKISNSKKDRGKRIFSFVFFSSQVGLATCQIARACGLKVLGTAGTEEGMNVILRNGAHQAFNHRDPNYTERIKVGMWQDSRMQVVLFLTKCEQLFAEDFKADLCRSNSVLPFSFLHKEKLSQAGKASFPHRQWHLELLTFSKFQCGITS